ncbi:hypothetical protein DPMN_015548 [Dreissena polymorpha]|uniref:Uncharacterized protein n=1 Tax=Dreissena polymorpha TaxID=45954 RepID=A0A9D4NBR7_DREPO|nr:hypothetical protein DPMN_015548 [Dreissena polymorpha]
MPPPLLPSLFRRCSKTTIHLRTVTIPLCDPSKSWLSAKSAGGGRPGGGMTVLALLTEPPVEVPISDHPQTM